MKDSIADRLRAYWTDHPVDRCEELLECSEDADRAHLDYAEYLFGEHRKCEAYGELDALLAAGHFSELWLSGVEMLEDHQPRVALCVYLLAIETIADEELRSPAHAARYLQLLAARRRLKWRLGMCLSEADLLVGIGYAEDMMKRWRVLDLVAERRVAGRLPCFWDRAAFGVLDQIRPRGSMPDPDRYYAEVEDVLRSRGRSGVSRLSLGDWERLVELAGDARRLDELPGIVERYGGGTTVVWPPRRNQLCWCGSGVKYKKCCGGPGY